MSYEQRCVHCEQTITCDNKKIFANHVRWCPKNVSNGDKGRQKLREILIKRHENTRGFLQKFDVVCHKCNSNFSVSEHSLRFPSKERYFCSRTCANTHVFSQERKDKISASRAMQPRKDVSLYNGICEYCKAAFLTKDKDKKKHAIVPVQQRIATRIKARSKRINKPVSSSFH